MTDRGAPEKWVRPGHAKKKRLPVKDVDADVRRFLCVLAKVTRFPCDGVLRGSPTLRFMFFFGRALQECSPSPVPCYGVLRGSPILQFMFFLGGGAPQLDFKAERNEALKSSV